MAKTGHWPVRLARINREQHRLARRGHAQLHAVQRCAPGRARPGALQGRRSRHESHDCAPRIRFLRRDSLEPRLAAPGLHRGQVRLAESGLLGSEPWQIPMLLPDTVSRCPGVSAPLSRPTSGGGRAPKLIRLDPPVPEHILHECDDPLLSESALLLLFPEAVPARAASLARSRQRWCLRGRLPQQPRRSALRSNFHGSMGSPGTRPSELGRQEFHACLGIAPNRGRPSCRF